VKIHYLGTICRKIEKWDSNSDFHKVTCKACLKKLQGCYNTQENQTELSRRLLEVRFLNKEPAVMRIAKLIASGIIKIPPDKQHLLGNMNEAKSLP
jgi:hypothetical protein